jgi:hypothetical protein
MMPEFSNHILSLFKKRAATEQVSSVGMPEIWSQHGVLTSSFEIVLAST